MTKQKLSQEQYNQLVELYTNYNISLNELGLITYNLDQLNKDLVMLTEKQNKLNDIIFDYVNKEQAILLNLKQQYGDFELDLQNKEIIINEK